jgi:hypothetical protein
MVCDLEDCSAKTVKSRRDVLAHLGRFLADRKLSECDAGALESFHHYLRDGHEEQRGRWGNPTQKGELCPLKIKGYHAILRAFFNFGRTRKTQGNHSKSGRQPRCAGSTRCKGTRPRACP